MEYRLPRVQAQPDSVYRGLSAEFSARLPAQVEHCLRLTLERLQLGLDKRNTKSIDNHEVQQLAAAASELYQIYTHLVE